MKRISLTMNDKQEIIYENFKNFVKEKNFGAIYGVLTNNIFLALENFMNERGREKIFKKEKKSKIFLKNEQFLEILSVDDKENIHNNDYGLPYHRFELLVGKVYNNCSESTYRDGIKSIIRINSFVIVEDIISKKKIYLFQKKYNWYRI